MYLMVEYRCPCGAVSESLEDRSAIPDTRACPSPGCTGMAERIISAPMSRNLTRRVQAVTTAKSDPRPAPGYMDTAPLADGMRWSDWKKQRQKQRRDQRYAEIKRMVG